MSEWEWPSQFVMKEVRKALDEHAANWHASHRLTTDSLLLGKLYQDEVFQKLRCETEYVAVRLGGREIEEIKFKAESYKLFSSSSHIDDVAPNVLYVPVESNKKSIDFVMPPWLFQ